MNGKIDPKVKEVLRLVAGGSLVAASFFLPGITPLAKPILENKRHQEKSEWKQFNKWRLKHVLRRMHQQKYVEVVESNDGYKVAITEKGKQRLLQYDLDEMMLEKKQWDGKWRIIIYDIDESKRSARTLFQKLLKKLHLYQLQKSVYLTPFPCENEIEYLRQIYSIGSEVVILTVQGFENDAAYKEYFGLT